MPETPDHSNAREEFTNIRVTGARGSSAGRWFTGSKEIINYKVISHFKQHLFRDEKGIYIYQTFRQFSEKGYITVEGPLLAVFRIDREKITFDSLDEIATATAEVVINTGDEAAYVYYPRLGCYAVVAASVSPDFSAFLKEEGDVFLFCDRPLRRLHITNWTQPPTIEI